MFSLIIYILIAAIGFMLGVLYKRTHTAASILNPDPKKALRVFSYVAGAVFVVLFALSFFETYTLRSTEIPEEANISYNNYHSTFYFLLNISFLILVVLADAYSQSLKKLAILPYVIAFGIYAVFILADAYYVSDIYLMWQKSMQMIQGELPDYTENSHIKCLLGFAVTAFNAAMIWWGLRK